jgi:3-methyladenine DNA glycosylase AlkD
LPWEWRSECGLPLPYLLSGRSEEIMPAASTEKPAALTVEYTVSAVLARLESLGTEQTRKTYLRHAAREPLFGVRYADLYKLEKEIKRAFRKTPTQAHELARELWETGNHDARILATLIADPAQLDDATLDRWMGDAGACHFLVDAVIGVLENSPLAEARRDVWRRSEAEWTGRAGWRLVARAAMNAATSDTYLAECLAEIEAGIHQAPNRKREAMNSALIAIGIRSPEWAEKATAAAGRIGKVHVDHGDTSCKTPDAAMYIQKTLARK